jgi:hypothetical protein
VEIIARIYRDDIERFRYQCHGNSICLTKRSLCCRQGIGTVRYPMSNVSPHRLGEHGPLISPRVGRAAPMNFVRRIRRKLSQTLGRRRCNLCGWHGWEFGSDSWHSHTICPKCKSHVRHRLMIACYSLLPEWSFDRLFKGRRVLHFAPERQVRHLVEQLASQYITADFLDPACDLRLNMSRMDALRPI